jgi:hypothetical protein
MAFTTKKWVQLPVFAEKSNRILSHPLKIVIIREGLTIFSKFDTNSIWIQSRRFQTLVQHSVGRHE